MRVRWALSLLLAACGAAPQPASLGVVDMELALRQTAEGQAEMTRLQRDFQVRQADLDARSAQLAAAQQQIEGASGPIGRSVAEANGGRCDTVVQWVNARDLLNRDFQVYRQELATSEAQAADRIAQRMRSIAQRIADERGLVIVFADDAYVAPGVRRVDLTEEMVREYDRLYPVR
jgi:Skp family chaperone for outer membrane proteins